MISIVIIVKNDPLIKETIQSLELIKYPEDHEIIIISSSKKTEEFSRSTVRVISFSNNSKKKITIPEQRNLGVKSARGDIIVFIDASCKPLKNWLTNLLKPILDKKENITAGQTISENQKSFRGRTKLLTKSTYLSEAPTFNLAIKSEVFKKVGFFDESFEYGSDVDFTWRSIEAGYKILFVPNAVLTHNWGSYSEEIQRAFRYGRARVRLYKKHKNKIDRLFVTDHVTLIYPVLLLVLPLIVIFPPLLLPYFLLLIKNRNNSPFFTITFNLFFGLGIWRELLQRN